MISSSTLIFYIYITVTFTFSYGICIKCYVCNSENDRRCLDPFDPNASGVLVRDCSVEKSNEKFATYFSNFMSFSDGNNKYLAKNKDKCVKVIFTDNRTNGASISRDCESSVECKEHWIENGTRRITSCYVCPDNHCNTSTKYSENFYVLLLVVIKSLFR